MALLLSQSSRGVDWLLVGSVLFLSLAGLVTIQSFGVTAEGASFFSRQLLFLGIGLGFAVLVSYVNFQFFQRTEVLMTLFSVGVFLLVLIFIIGSTVKGATSWFQFGAFSFQPSDPIKIILIAVLAKYLSRRHVEIHNVKHLFITGFYFLVPFILVFLQPDFGSAVILFAIWFGMILVAGVSWKHVAVLVGLVLVAFGGLWFFVFEPYQKDRITSFLAPLEDIQGAGYNAYQSTIAVGSGKLTGKGLGYGTQSRLSFLPEHQTDFVFASFSEEWGFVGSLLVLTAYGVLIWRILAISGLGMSNFEVLFGVGISLYFVSHIFINIGMNVGLLPVTGITLPFMSYGGSHLITELVAVGLVMSIRRHRQRVTDRDYVRKEVILYA